MLRLAGIAYPYFLRVDPVLGFSLRPGAEGWFVREGRAYIKISSQGLRDREHNITAAPDTLRVAILGNSFAEALQVPVEDTFWSHLQTDLQSCSAVDSKKIEAINFGISSFSTVQQLLMLKEKVWQYKPDIVVLLFMPDTDIRKNSRAIFKSTDRPYMTMKDNKLIEDNSFRDTDFFRFQTSLPARMLHTLINHSRVLQIINERRRTGGAQEQSGVIAESPSQETIDPVFLPPTSQEWTDAWDVTERAIAEMNHEATARNVRFVLFITDETRQSDLTDFQYPVARLTALGHKEGFEVVSLTPSMKAYIKEHDVFLHGFKPEDKNTGHWNQEGHRVVSTVMSDVLCADLSR